MNKTTTFITAGLLAAFSLSAAAGGPPAGVGERGKPEGIACQHAGIGTLQALGLLAAVAKDGIEVEGVGVLDFKTVLELHRTMPQLFKTGGVSVIVDGMAVPATWCD
jgi:hypothetical protein